MMSLRCHASGERQGTQAPRVKTRGVLVRPQPMTFLAVSATFSAVKPYSLNRNL